MFINETEKRDLLKTVFDVIPSMIFVVDQDMRIEEYNLAAVELMKTDRHLILKHRTGDILHCIHAQEDPEGCGRAYFCEDCVIRNSVKEAFQGNRTVRRRSKLELVLDGNKTMIYALITASPFSFNNLPLALLVVEDISELAELHRLIPICAGCRQVRDNEELWMPIENYFKNNWDVDFTHGLCPDCYKIEVDKILNIRTNQTFLPTRKRRGTKK